MNCHPAPNTEKWSDLSVGPRRHQTLMEATPPPLSSRAQPRDLQFCGPFLGMYFDGAKPRACPARSRMGICSSLYQHRIPTEERSFEKDRHNTIYLTVPFAGAELQIQKAGFQIQCFLDGRTLPYPAAPANRQSMLVEPAIQCAAVPGQPCLVFRVPEE